MVNRQSLRDQLAQLSIRIKAQQIHCAELKKDGHTTIYADANRKLKQLIKERQNIVRRLHGD